MFKNVKGGAILAEFGEVLAQLRQKRHISQAELGRAIFVSGGTISNYEKGVHFPDVEKLLLLADYFNVTTDYLLGKSNQRTAIDADTPDIYLRLAQGAKQMDLSERDIKTLLDIARTLKERDEQHDQ